MKKIIVIVFVLTLLCEPKTAFAQRVLIISDTVSSAGVCQYASLFRDTTGRMPFENVQKQTFKQVNKPLFQYAFSEDTFWFRFQIRNQSILNENNWYFLWSDALKDYVDVYVPAPSCADDQFLYEHEL